MLDAEPIPTPMHAHFALDVQGVARHITHGLYRTHFESCPKKGEFYEERTETGTARRDT